MTALPLFTRVDHVVIAVRDLAAAEGAYTRMLGLRPSLCSSHPAYGTTNVLFGLANCSVELLAPGRETPPHPVTAALTAYLARRPEGVFALALGSDDVDGTALALRAAGVPAGPVSALEAVGPEGAVRRARILSIAREHTRGVNVFAIEHDARTIPRALPSGVASAAASAVDHVVLFSDDLASALALWRDAFAIPERWRRELPERGTVNVGLRLGGVTLELVAPLGSAAGERGERAWGIAYTVEDCDAAVARLRAAAIPVSDARAGLAPATRVATVKWPERVPTLLIEHRR